MFHGRTAQRISDELAAMFDESLTVLCKLLNRDHRKLLAANLIEALLGWILLFASGTSNV